MTPARTTIVKSVTETERVIAQLAVLGVHVQARGMTVNRLYGLVCKAIKQDCEPRTLNGQWLFLRSWLDHRERSIAGPRVAPAFKPYVISAGMRAALARCAESDLSK